jgi:hypothetical protein
MPNMEKRLIAIGNGFGLLIDKPLRRMLGIQPGTLLQVTTDGTRLFVEACGDDGGPRKVRKKLDPWDQPKFVSYTGLDSSEERRLEYFSLSIAGALQNKGVTHAQFMGLNHRIVPWDFYEAMIRNGCPNSEDRVDMRRLEVCWHEISSGASMADSMSRALAAVPMGTRKKSMLHGSYCLGVGCPCNEEESIRTSIAPHS